mgnify:CR=1 FL=1
MANVNQKLAHNVTIEHAIDEDGSNNKLVITVDLDSESYVSPSGKSDVLATTRGNVRLPGFGVGEVVKMGLNIFRVR